MVVFPAFATLVSALCAIVIGRDALARPAPHKTIWTLAFLLFAIAAGAETIATADKWTPLLVRIFYLSGAVLTVAFLGMGELYLLARRRVEKLGPGILILITAVGASLVWAAEIDRAELSRDGWEAMERGPALITLVAITSGVGSLILIGGALWSAWRFRRRRDDRWRMIGCLLIALGTITVGIKGTLSRFDLPEPTFNIALAAGVLIIFVGYLATRSTERSAQRAAPVSVDRTGLLTLAPVPFGRVTAPVVGTTTHDAALAFLETRVLALDDAGLDRICTGWSVPRQKIEAMSRAEARKAWLLRTRLSAQGQDHFDHLPVAAIQQVMTLFFEVLAPDAGPEAAPVRRDRIRAAAGMVQSEPGN